MFLCFSSGDRYTVVKSCLYHLKNYGIPVWYDYHELILGDLKKEKNFEHAINSNKYFIIVYSEAFFKSPCALNEEYRIFSQLEERDIVIFPLLYNIKFRELPIVAKKQKNRKNRYIKAISIFSKFHNYIRGRPPNHKFNDNARRH